MNFSYDAFVSQGQGDSNDPLRGHGIRLHRSCPVGELDGTIGPRGFS